VTTDLTRLLVDHHIAISNPFGDPTEAEEAGGRLVAALEAVVAVLDRNANEAIARYKANSTSYGDGYSDGAQVAELRALDAITAALDETKEPTP